MIREDDDKVFDTMVIELPFEVDEEFFDHGVSSDGVTYIDVSEDGEMFLVIDMMKKKAERKAKPTPVFEVPGKKKKIHLISNDFYCIRTRYICAQCRGVGAADRGAILQYRGAGDKSQNFF